MILSRFHGFVPQSHGELTVFPDRWSPDGAFRRNFAQKKRRNRNQRPQLGRYPHFLFSELLGREFGTSCHERERSPALPRSPIKLSMQGGPLREASSSTSCQLPRKNY